MSNLFYIDVMRQITPADKTALFTNTHFFVFGEFDSMYIESVSKLKELKQLYEKRHEGPDGFPDPNGFLTTDRQPVFLYSNKVDSIRIFERNGDDEIKPLVFTLFQLDKESIKNTDLASFIDACNNDVEDVIKRRAFCDKKCNADTECIKKEVFWNLGAADLAIVFRANSLSCIAWLVIALRQIASIAGIQILSTSSYFGFPKSENWGNSINAWLEIEKQLGMSLSVSYNVIPGEDLPNEQLTFLFGEWDYKRTVDVGKETSDVPEFLKSIIKNNLSTNTESDLWYRTTYTEPSYPINTNSPHSVFPINPLNLTKYKEGIIERKKVIEDTGIKLRNKFQQLSQIINRCEFVFGKANAMEIESTLSSYKNTIYGLLGFLTRLLVGRYEQDLCQYTLPIFNSLKSILDSYINLFERDIIYFDPSFDWAALTDEQKSHIRKIIFLSNNNDKYYDASTIDECKKYLHDYLEEIAEECMRDTGILITRLQQIFVVHAVSPHTFLETYGSSMRSLSAASKLVGAYQGLFRFIDDKLCTSIDQINHASHNILITPYRHARPENLIIYRTSNPQKRISLIQIDYTKMFWPETIFMLLHEAAHSQSNRLREERLRFFILTRIQEVLYSVVHKFLDSPLETFINSEIEADPGTHTKKKLFFDLSVESGFAELIRNKIISLVENEDDIADKLVELYKQEEGYDLFFNHLNAVDEWTRYVLTESILKESYAEEFGEKLRLSLLDISKQIRLNINTYGGNVREAIRVEELYKQPDVYKRLIKDFPETIKRGFENQLSRTLFTDLFRDVYADLFAIVLLDDNSFKEADYINALFCFVGADAPPGLDGG